MRPILMAVALLCARPGYAQSTTDPATQPELGQEALLPQIASAMRRTLRDPSSVIDLTMCPPIKVKVKDGRPVRWTVLLSFNAKNGYGGYEGQTYYGALFNAGQPARLDRIIEANAQGLDTIVTHALAKQMAGCPLVPGDRLRAALKGNG